MTPPHRYRAFGLAIESVVPCPELTLSTAASADEAPDVVVTEAVLDEQRFPAPDAESWFRASDGELRFRIEGVGCFEVSNGQSVRFQRDPSVPPPGVTDADVRVFLLGSCLGAILQQRGVLALHASTAIVDGLAVAFVGRSGAGKSTTLAALLAEGHTMLSDDVSAVDCTAGRVDVRPAYGQVKLNPDSAAHLAVDARELRWINRFRSKHALARPDRLATESVPLSAVIALEPSVTEPSVTCTPVRGAERFALLHRNAYRQIFHEGLNVREQMAEQIMRVSTRCRIYRLHRPAAGPVDTAAVLRCVHRIIETTPP